MRLSGGVSEDRQQTTDAAGEVGISCTPCCQQGHMTKTDMTALPGVYPATLQQLGKPAFKNRWAAACCEGRLRPLIPSLAALCCHSLTITSCLMVLSCCTYAAIEKRWTVFSSMWYLWQELRFFGIPPAVRYICHLAWRTVLMRLYEAHKLLVLWRE